MKANGPLCIAAAGLLLLVPAAAAAQDEAGGTVSADVSATAGAGATGLADAEGWFLQPGIGAAIPLADSDYDFYIDTSLDLSFAAGYLFSLGGGEAYIGPEVAVAYTFEDVDDELESGGFDAYAGRFRALAGGRFQIDFGGPFLFCRFLAGLDLMHVSWESTGAIRAEDDGSDAGLGLLNSIGFGARVSDMVGIVVVFDFPTSVHGHANFGTPPGSALDFPSLETTDVEMTLGVTIRL